MIQHNNHRRLALVAAAFSVVGFVAADAFAHGTIVDSRVYRVRKAGEAANLMGAWTSAMYDWAADSNTFTDYDQPGFEYPLHVADGTIASAGKNDGTNGTLDFSKVNNPGAWPTSPAAAGTSLAQKWVAPAPHDPSYFDVWITKPGFNVLTDTIRWGDLEKLGRWEKNTSLNVTTTPNGGVGPADSATMTSYDWNIPIAANRGGRAAVVTVWQRRDSAGEAFFSVQDLMVAPTGNVWKLATGGSYTAPVNWTGNSVPSSVDRVATFGNTITANAAITLNPNVLLGTLRFDSAYTYTLGGTGTVMFETSGGDALLDAQQGSHVIGNGVMLHSSTTAAVATSASLEINGALTFSASNIVTKTGGGTLRINASSVTGASNAMFVNAGGKLQIDKPLSPSIGVFTANGAETRFGASGSIGSLTMSSAGTKVAIDSAPASALVVKATGLGIGSNTTLDVGDNALFIDYTGAGNSPLGQMNFYARLGVQNNHAGPGLISSAAAANAKMGVGIVEASAIGSPATFMGTSADATTVIARYTLKGDADINGIVNFQDLVALAQHYNAAGTWRDGDSNYSGMVDFADLVSLAQNYNQSLASDGSTLVAIGGSAFAADFALAQSLVPEPATLSTLGLAAAAIIRRR